MNEGHEILRFFEVGKMMTAPDFTDGRPKCALMRNSFAPASCLIFQTNADLSGAYVTEPVDVYRTNQNHLGQPQH